MTNPMFGPAEGGAAQHLATDPAEPERYVGGDEAEDDFELPPRQRIPVVTRLLVGAIALSVAFTGGVLVEKHYNAYPTSSAAGVPNFGSGGFPGGGTGSTGTATSGTTGASSSTSSVPVLVGTVVSVSGDDVSVKDLGGTTHTVHTTTTTAVTITGRLSGAALKPGATVTVNGAKASDGSVTATSLTVK